MGNCGPRVSNHEAMEVIKHIELNCKNDCITHLWSGAIDTIDELNEKEIETILNCLEEGSFNEPMELGEINDFLWFERDTIAHWLGYQNFEEIMERNRGDE